MIDCNNISYSKCPKLYFCNMVMNEGNEIRWANADQAISPPEITNGSVKKTNINGMYQGKNTYGDRFALIKGIVVSLHTPIEELKNTVDSCFSLACNIGCENQYRDIVIQKNNTLLRNKARVVDGVNWIYNTKDSLTFTVTIQFEDYYFRGGCEDECITISSSCSEPSYSFSCDSVTPGSCSFDNMGATFPDFSLSPSQTEIIENNGTYCAFPHIRIKGSPLNPVIGNKTTGQKAKINISLSNQMLDIDTYKYSVRLSDGCNIFSSISLLEGELPILIPGENEIYIYDECCSDFTADILFFDSYVNV